MTAKNKISSILKDLKRYLEFEKESGINDLYLEKGGIISKNVDKEKKLKNLAIKVSACSGCSLSETRKNVVFGSGNPKARLVFVGEAPGYDEDVQGLPFVGRAGQLLTKIIESIKYDRKNVYICNILKCRPPQNRSPLPSEIFACQEYLIEQLNIIKPKLICALGKFAAQTLLKTDTPISLLRGKFYDYQGIKLIPTFHPAYLLRNPNDKRLVWEDMKKIKKFLEAENGKPR
ncbi:MAG: uracil-DNA glycosylase [Candidatus Omnitrophica bacterium CG07_land_8_20_14_0_80_42_15]|uniref:Type-4 uracil-DNA glycosylase n=1 Tax=Candidatus Aquitaenariimonas noxiae TaxID=1974741 RepID=A0A2J0KRA6_9BACT|nr:MAG: uracil-DNA glycosylase [Candidatus Omnitrophica bacterium CG07_land_8_20_14_0_80_42_15]